MTGESVSDIIAARSQEPSGFSAMIGWSVVAHIILGAAVGLSLVEWMSRPAPRPTAVMTISLGGSPGPRTGGLTSIGGQTIQAPAPVEPVKRAETPPAPKPPEMALPTKTTRPPRPPVTQAPRDATGRTPTTGAEPVKGSTPIDTKVRGQGFGLTTGGGGGNGVQLDVSNFCCPEYLEQMVRAIRQNWESNQGIAGEIVMRFTIGRTGAIAPESIQLERSSGFVVHEMAAKRALLNVKLAPLPPAYSNSTLGIHMTFQYAR